MEHEFDYYTAVDDLRQGVSSEDDKGAAMIGDIEFTSACYYKYFSIDLDGFVDNFVGQIGVVESDELERARAVAIRATLAFFEAAVFASPSGKQIRLAVTNLRMRFNGGGPRPQNSGRLRKHVCETGDGRS